MQLLSWPSSIQEDRTDVSSVISSVYSELPRGLLFRPNKRICSGTAYDSIQFNDKPVNKNRKTGPSAHLPYTEDETRLIFEFMYQNSWLRYMLGLPICKLMSNEKVCFLNYFIKDIFFKSIAIGR